MAPSAIHLPLSADALIRTRKTPFVLDRAAMGQVFLWGLLRSPVSIISPLLHINLYLQLLSERQAGEPWVPSNKASFRYWEHGKHQRLYNTILPYLWYHHTYMCDDTRDCIIQFVLLMMSTCARNM